MVALGRGGVSYERGNPVSHMRYSVDPTVGNTVGHSGVPMDREILIDNLLVQVHWIIEMIVVERWKVGPESNHCRRTNSAHTCLL